MRDFDLIVIGAGNAMDVLRDAGEAGLRVAVVERGPLGGTCPNRGCIPSKLLLAHADVAHAIRTSRRFHFEARIEAVDADRVLAETREYINRFDSLLAESLPASVTLFRGHGRFSGGHTVQVEDDELTAPRIVIATGSRPRRLPLGVPYWTSDEVFQLQRAPKSLVIVGGGYVATELAHFFHGIGVETLMIVRDDRLLPSEEEDTRRLFQDAFTQRIDVRFGTEVERATHDGATYRLVLNSGETVQTEGLLLAVGRVPNSDDLGLEAAGIAVDGDGYVTVDDHLRTGVDGVYALGDVIGRYAFTHAAVFEAKYVAAQILGRSDAPIDYGPMPHAVFTEPELASVGSTERELVAENVEFVTASAPYSSATKGRAIREEHGLVKLLLDPEGAILGAHIVGAHASILLHEIIPVMKWRNHISSLTGIVHVHPSLAEVVRGAARKAEAALHERVR